MTPDDDVTICDRCATEIDASEATTGGDDCGEWKGCTLCPECAIEAKDEAKP